MTYAFIAKKGSTKKSSLRNSLYNCLSLYTVKIYLLYVRWVYEDTKLNRKGVNV
jgi:phosphoserine aminotransferase